MLAGEALGVFIITFTGCGALMVDVLSGGVIGHVGVSMVFGLAYGVAILSLAGLCRCHFNPLLSIGFSLFSDVPAKQSAAAVVAQIIGGFVAVGVLSLMLGDTAALGASFPVADIALVADADPIVIAAATEFMIAAILMFVAASVSVRGKLAGGTAALSIGAAVLLLTLLAGPLDGAPMNPARALAPALVTGNVDTLWIYLVMPVLGGLLGGGLRALLDK